MKAIVVTDQAAGTAGMKLMERPEPQAAINDVIIQVHAPGFVPTELTWPSTSTDRRDRDRTPSVPRHELAAHRHQDKLRLKLGSRRLSSLTHNCEKIYAAFHAGGSGRGGSSCCAGDGGGRG
jgi:hypothetical protein